MDTVHTLRSPAPAGHYSQGIVHRGIVYVAGQLPIDPRSPDSPPESAEEQTEQALRNVEEVLREAGSGLDRVLLMTVYISDLALWPNVNTAFSRVMGQHRPARAVVPVSGLRKGFLVEIQAIAAVDHD